MWHISNSLLPLYKQLIFYYHLKPQIRKRMSNEDFQQQKQNIDEPNLQLSYQDAIDLSMGVEDAEEVIQDNFCVNQVSLEVSICTHTVFPSGASPAFQKLQNQISKSAFCTICRSFIHKKTKIPSLICHHTFHLKCFKKWAKIKKECPYCRQKLNNGKN